MAITTIGLADFAKAIRGTISKGAVVNNGASQTVDIFKSEVIGNELVVYLLFDQSYAGTLTRFRLLNASNQVIVEETDNVQKVYNKLLLVTFKFSLNERVVTG